jgi:hypothetical protein
VIEYKLKSGDLLVTTTNGVAILIKDTRTYWYYIYKEKEARVKKTKLWSYLDQSKFRVRFGSSMKYRRKKKTGRLLDLHGLTHDAAPDKIREYLNFIELPTTIITGKSEKMKKIVKNIVQEYGWYCSTSARNTGQLVITKKTIKE